MKKAICLILAFLILVLIIPGCSQGNSEGASATVQPEKSQSPGASSSADKQASGSESSQSQQIKPEQLISKEEAVKLVGESVKAGVNEKYPLLGLNTCFYAPEKSDSKSYLQVCLIQNSALKQGGGEQSGQSSKSSETGGPESGNSESGGSAGKQSESGGEGGEEMSPKTLYEGLKKLFSDPNTALTGRIGDDIFISAQGISILSGEHCIVILMSCADPAKTAETLKQAGELAISNLKRIQGE